MKILRLTFGGALLGALACVVLAGPSCASLAGLANDPCTPSYPPPQPPPTTAMAGADIVLAVKNLSFAIIPGTNGAANAVEGLDLDHACTKEDGTPSTCIPQPNPTLKKDNSDGADNALGWLILDNTKPLNSLLNINPLPRVTLLLTLSGYNRQLNDDGLLLQVFTTGGVAPVDEAGVPSSPAWNSSDQWTLSCETLASGLACNGVVPLLDGGLFSSVRDENAYVSNGVLVSKGLGTVPVIVAFDLGTGPPVAIPVTLSEAVFEAHLALKNNQVEIQSGLLGGRWELKDMLPAIADFLCPTPVQPAVGSYLCQAADLSAGAMGDGTGQRCSALSVGIAFEAPPATIGSYRAPIQYNTRCDAGPQSCP